MEEDSTIQVEVMGDRVILKEANASGMLVQLENQDIHF